MRRAPWAWAGLALVLAAAALAGLLAGTERIPWRHVLALIAQPSVREADPTGAQIVLMLRLPRVMAAAMAGACLSVSGVALQSLLQNPLADPYVLGVSAGASAGAAVVIALGLVSALAGFAIPVAALAGALAATALVFGLARSGGRMSGPLLLLSGVVVASVLGSLVSMILYLSGAQDRMQAILLWTMGGFSEADGTRVCLLAPVAIAGAGALWAMGRGLNLLAFGEDPARFLGADVDRVRSRVLFLAALLTACAVAVGGVIGFVGLIVPHAARRIVGPDHRALLPAAFLGGAAFLVLADLAARTVHPPMEVPVGLLTGVLGGPFFLGLLRAKAGKP
ncbi:MAG TPA: iron ABC transporter permease [Armatimonadota bacterium]|jgi:iron complex transport system permease protein